MASRVGGYDWINLPIQAIYEPDYWIVDEKKKPFAYAIWHTSTWAVGDLYTINYFMLFVYRSQQKKKEEKKQQQQQLKRHKTSLKIQIAEDNFSREIFICYCFDGRHFSWCVIHIAEWSTI